MANGEHPVPQASELPFGKAVVLLLNCPLNYAVNVLNLGFDTRNFYMLYDILVHNCLNWYFDVSSFPLDNFIWLVNVADFNFFLSMMMGWDFNIRIKFFHNNITDRNFNSSITYFNLWLINDVWHLDLLDNLLNDWNFNFNILFYSPILNWACSLPFNVNNLGYWFLDNLFYLYVFLPYNLFNFIYCSIDILDFLLIDNDWLINVLNLDHWLHDNLLYFYVFDPFTLNWTLDDSFKFNGFFHFEDSLNRSVDNFVSDNFAWNFYNPLNCLYLGRLYWNFMFNNDFMMNWYFDNLLNFVWTLDDSLNFNFMHLTTWYFNFPDDFSVSVNWDLTFDRFIYIIWDFNVSDDFSLVVSWYFNFPDDFSISEYFNFDVSIIWNFNMSDDFSLFNNWNLNCDMLHNLSIIEYFTISFDNLFLSVHWDVVNNLSFIVDIFMNSFLMMLGMIMSIKMVMMVWFVSDASSVC